MEYKIDTVKTEKIFKRTFIEETPLCPKRIYHPHKKLDRSDESFPAPMCMDFFKPQTRSSLLGESCGLCFDLFYAAVFKV